ncbi:hypothetical protein ATE67_14015 [Sphingopyxis sp. H050]|jgi:hypothetical protein|uniref:hypothetical protein n=1 Tax=Sphingopyxis sp. H050 TaxID=1759072 RepID=UPI0007375B7E|nr:hypothetical protein [Sphingopyxis sp. H050]KTE19749.1 hypothetical protein ATE67_14015 [Sphingopyxis sp. H050]
MTVRTIGWNQKMARLSLGALAASLALGPPVWAQTDAPAPTPAPSSTFRLPPASDGRTPGVQGPADNNLPPLGPADRQPTPAPTPAPAPPPVVATQPPASTARPAPAPTVATPTRRDTPAATTAAPRAAATDAMTPTPVVAAPDIVAPASAAGPGFTTDPTAPSAVPVVPAAASVPAGGDGGTPLWAWLLAGLAAAGAGFWYWRRRPAIAGDAPADYAKSTPPPAPKPLPRAAEPARPASPAQRAPSPAPIAPPRPAGAPLVTRPQAEQRALVSMALEIRGIRMTAEQLIVAFTLNLLNQGSVDATGLMVRIALNQGSAMPEPVLQRFFDGAGGSVLRDDMRLAPGAGEQLSTEVMLPRAAVEPLMIGGKPMMVPVLAFDVTYHWDGTGEAFGQNAGSFVLGREQGASASDKLAPLPLDRPNLVVNRPAARTTAIKRSQ